MKVKSDDRTIGEVLQGHFLKVPRFQRPYEWTKEEVDDFWDDIHGANNDYFIGSMVLFQSTHGLQGIVDGQQRLTTITLLLCILRDELERVGLTDEGAGLHNLIERRSVLDNKSHFVLQTDESSPYLRYMQSFPRQGDALVSDAEKLLRLAADLLRTRVRRVMSQDPAKAQEHLLKLRQTILGLRLITVEVDNEDDATVIFQTLNSRGRDLATADLVKSHLFSHLRAENPANDAAREKWTQIRAGFSASRADLPIDRFLLHSWLSRRDYLAQADLGKTVRKSIRRTEAMSYLDGLVLDARLYREINEPDFRDTWQREERPCKAAFSALQTFRVRQPLPWLLAVWRDYDGGNLKLKHANAAATAIERFHFLSTAVASQPSSGGISKMYATHARQLFAASSGQAKVEIIRDLHKKISAGQRLPTLDQFAAAFAQVKYSRVFTQQSRLVAYTLSRLHAHFVAAPIDFSQMTIEHIAPQTRRVGPTAVSVLDVARLGNLILVPKELNEKLGTKSFKDKQALLQAAADDGLYVDPYVLSASRWTEDQIHERTRTLAEAAYGRVWSLAEVRP
ncbi:DUF262 domain-containing protein [Mycobacterium sp. Aquia_213]|uniref:DUF262 domain-containing protein n=1 Tax=Mycobacterium sp. Aquia_213 TaxID=2991728 RepID=UPI00226F65E8|nr:DUF262 domain-containing protein [Mycobacterium sp. Aquia_213]WAC93485.1 DUF262 domain-containing protein [Mycobacterium sp. Aquia_213]